jgi:penicillin-binding protein 1C
VALAIWLALPRSAPFFELPLSTVLYANNGSLLSAITAKDGQWRFPVQDSLPAKYKTALLYFEDEQFYNHNGVYLPGMMRATVQNMHQGKIVSGGSTITMQVVRMSRQRTGRSIHDKIYEVLCALQLEAHHSKEEILQWYAANAPYGGNVVGLEAAAWRYFGRKPYQLSWAESACLAVLPNAPALIFPGRNHDALLKKRNVLLEKLAKHGCLSEEELMLSLAEPLPEKPFELPQQAQHLLTTLTKKNGFGKKFDTTIDYSLQQSCMEVVSRHQRMLEANNVHNMAVLVVEVSTGNVKAYVGNTHDVGNRYGNHVDCAVAPRSIGSILKPILFAAMLQEGKLLPHSLVADVPMQFDGFAPKNYSETFDGAVPASQALSKSLNVPAVAMLKEYGYPRFYQLLKGMGFSHLSNSADHYGLSLILGGAEASLWDITHAYAGMSRSLMNFEKLGRQYDAQNYERRNTLLRKPTEPKTEPYTKLEAGAIWSTYQALLGVNRPDTELGWEEYDSSLPIAWKTGTSFGNRDAWAIGTTPEYVVGVWVGNADGEGRPELTGVAAAAPVMFDVFRTIVRHDWFPTPYADMQKIAVCKASGMRMGMLCSEADTLWVPKAGLVAAACSFHKNIWLNDAGEQVNKSCYSGPSHEVTWFVLPPVQASFYKTKHPQYVPLPRWSSGCEGEGDNPLGLIYPRHEARVFIPRNVAGQQEKLVFEAAHTLVNANIHWHMDGVYLGTTNAIHEMQVVPSPGKHVLTIVDDEGNQLVRQFEALPR